jgi:hypothetical protein
MMHTGKERDGRTKAGVHLETQPSNSSQVSAATGTCPGDLPSDAWRQYAATSVVPYTKEAGTEYFDQGIINKETDPSGSHVLHRAEELREAALIDENGGIQQTDGDHSGPHVGGDFGSVSFEHDGIDEESRRDDGTGYVADQEDAHGSAADQTNDSGSAVY